MTRKESTINIEHIEATKDVATLRELLLSVEEDIKGIVGNDPLSFYLERPSQQAMEEIDNYIGLRTMILDKMFTYAPDEIERMEQVNTLLTDLRKNMCRRTCALYRTLLAHGVDKSFDDDYEVEGKLTVGVEYDSKEGDYVYFVHSFYGKDCDESLLATSEYGIPVTASAANENVMGCQFHPEKSGEVGLRILKAFSEI